MERRIRQARFPAVKGLDGFDFAAIPSLNKMLVLELARGEYVERQENVIALGNSGTGKTHVALGLGLAACQRGMSVGFATAAALVHELLEARDEKRLLRLQKQLAATLLHGSARGRSEPILARGHAMRTDSGRPSSSMRFSTPTAMATSVACRPSVCERSVSPITRL